MRRAASFLVPVTLISAYYAFWVGLMAFLLDKYPAIGKRHDYLLVGAQ